MAPDDPARPDYHTVFNGAPGNFLLLAPNLRILGVSDAYLAATMTARDQILGRGLFEIFPDNPDDPAADGVRNLRASLLRALETRRPDRMPVQKYDIRRPNGAFEERHWSPLNSPVFGPDGEVAYLIHSVEDVTEVIRLKQAVNDERSTSDEQLRDRDSRLEAETFLRTEAIDANLRLTASEKRYRTLADAVPQLICTAHGAGFVDYCNARWTAFSGRDAEALHGDGWQQLLHEDDRERVKAEWLAAVRDHVEQFEIEHRLCRYDGEWRTVLTTVLRIQDGVDGGEKWLASTTDIHDHVQADQKLREAQRLQSVGEMAGGMAHEVNNMMSAVLGFGELVLAALGADHPQRADVEEMVKAGGRAAQVTRHLLAFSRRQVLQPAVVDIDAVIADLAPVLRRMLGSDRRLDIGTSPIALRAIADRSQFEQVLINLIANARDATHTNGVVTVHAERVQVRGTTLAAYRIDEVEPGPFVRITVRDDGTGMSPETVARAFEPFFTTKPLGQGTGLGLSMVYGIVRQSGGYVTIESGINAGTAIAVYLPFVDADPAVEEGVAPTARGQGECVLVVEDEGMVRAITARALQAVGYVVQQAPNGAVALDYLLANASKVALVLSDLVMPNVNGQQLAARMAAEGINVPILFMSAYSAEEISRRGLGGPGIVSIQKPFTLDALATAVRDRIERSRGRRDA